MDRGAAANAVLKTSISSAPWVLKAKINGGAVPTALLKVFALLKFSYESNDATQPLAPSPVSAGACGKFTFAAGCPPIMARRQLGKTLPS